MKKIFKLYIFAMFITFIGVVNVYAGSPTLTINRVSANDNVVYTTDNSTTTNYEIKINTDGESIERVDFRIDFGASNAHVSIVNGDVTAGSGLIHRLENATHIVYQTGAIATDKVIATIALTLRNPLDTQTSSSFTISNIVYHLTGETTMNGTDISRPISLQKTASADPNAGSALLRGITLNNNAALSPAFDSNVKTYRIDLRDTIRSLTVTPVCLGENCTTTIECDVCEATSQGNGVFKIDLSLGRNTVTIKTTSPNGQARDAYTLKINRGESFDGSNFLQSLTLSGFTFDFPFDRMRVDYQVILPFEVDTIADLLVAQAEDVNAEVVIDGPELLEVGEENANIFTITVKPTEGAAPRIYNLTVIRLEEGEVFDTTTSPIIEDTVKPKSKAGLIIGIIVVGLTIVGVSGYALFGRKKKKNAKIKDDKAIDNKEEIPETNLNEENENSNSTVFDDENHQYTVDTALDDLMQTKEIINTGELMITREMYRTKEIEIDNKEQE